MLEHIYSALDLLELINILWISVIYFLLTFSIQFFWKKNTLIKLKSMKYHGEQRVHDGEIPRIGGLIIFLTLILFAFFTTNLSLSQPLQLILLSALPMMIVITKEDVWNNVDIKWRLIALIISSVLLLFLLLDSFPDVSHIPLLSNLFQYPLFSFGFFTLCLVALANGCNFIDGMNGLLGFYLLGALMGCLNLSLIANDLLMTQFVQFYFILTVLFLLTNFPWGKIFMGDSGAYLMALLIGIWVIYFFSIHDSISSWNAGLIFFYPIMEVTYSIIRKLIQKKSPFHPDRDHLHLKIFDIVNTAIKKPRLANNLTTVFLALFWLTPPLILPWVYNNHLLISIALVILCLSYVVLALIIPAKHEYVSDK